MPTTTAAGKAAQEFFRNRLSDAPRAGGASLITMQGPDGTRMPNRSVCLAAVTNEHIVFTAAYIYAWAPSAKDYEITSVWQPSRTNKNGLASPPGR